MSKQQEEKVSVEEATLRVIGVLVIIGLSLWMAANLLKIFAVMTQGVR